MAEWRGMKVKLNNPTRIQKGEPGYGRKKFKSPSGRIYTKKQVQLYYATNGFRRIK